MQAWPMLSCGVCLSGCPSITFVDCVKTNRHIFRNFSPSASHIILVFRYRTLVQYSHGNSSNGSVECRWGRQKSRFSANIWADRIDDFWSASNNCDGPPYGLLHREQRILFITACSMDDHNEEKRTEQNLIVHSGKCEAEVTNN